MTGTSLCEMRYGHCMIPDRPAFLQMLRGIAAAHGTRIICFNADLMAGPAHAELAIRLAGRAFENGDNISNTLEMEALLYAAGSRQCSTAASFGIHEGENRLFVCCCPPEQTVWPSIGQIVLLNKLPDDSPSADHEERLMAAFGISSEEIAAAGGRGRLMDLVLERVALLQILR